MRIKSKANPRSVLIYMSVLFEHYFWVASIDSAVGRGDGKCSARCCRGREFESRGGP